MTEKELYAEFRNECINNIHYIKTPFYGKDLFVCDIAELIIRRSIVPFPNENTTEQDYINRIDALSNLNKSFIRSAVYDIVDLNLIDKNLNNITLKGNAPIDLYKNAIESIQELFAFFFVQYFGQFKFGNNMDIANKFSLLPPVIRFRTLDHLYKLNPYNPIIIEKYVLSLVKTYSADRAASWVMQNKEKLQSMSSRIESLSLYDLCVKQINPEYEKLVVDFETIKKSYFENGLMPNDNDENILFNYFMSYSYNVFDVIPAPLSEGGSPYATLNYFYNLEI